MSREGSAGWAFSCPGASREMILLTRRLWRQTFDARGASLIEIVQRPGKLITQIVPGSEIQDVSLPEIGGYTNPDIFDKEKSKRNFLNIYRSQLMLCVVFLYAVDD